MVSVVARLADFTCSSREVKVRLAGSARSQVITEGAGSIALITCVTGSEIAVITNVTTSVG